MNTQQPDDVFLEAGDANEWEQIQERNNPLFGIGDRVCSGTSVQFTEEGTYYAMDVADFCMASNPCQHRVTLYGEEKSITKTLSAPRITRLLQQLHYDIRSPVVAFGSIGYSMGRVNSKRQSAKQKRRGIAMRCSD